MQSALSLWEIMSTLPADKSRVRRDLAELADEIVRVAGRLRRIDAALHGDSALSEAERVVLFLLFSAGEISAPALARMRSVTRQRSQQILNSLTEAGLAERVANPASEKSPLYRLTRAGQAATAALHKKEYRLYATLPELLGERKIKNALVTLRQMGTELDRSLRRLSLRS
jgi:DNA-binding MarR family transcriptional regulator